MEQYTASNGVAVRKSNNLGLVVKDGTTPNTVIASAAHEQALREFFRAEEDERLGRWRWPENPDYVVYPRADHVAVVNEQSGNAMQSTRDQAEINTGLCRAARAYFDAHPEPKPWHNAKPGEVWVFTTNEGTFPAFVEDRISEGGNVLTFDSWTTEYMLTDEGITAGRRIWPEENA